MYCVKKKDASIFLPVTLLNADQFGTELHLAK